MRILRVFPKRTSYTPDDDLTFIGPPPFAEMIPEHDEVHISCTFTWDMDECEDLAFQWEGATRAPVKLGGPAFHSTAEDFVPGLYVRKGIIFTSRGCNNNCPWCGVRKMEGKLRELPICEGNVIQDNNFLQCSRQHQDKVFDMLRQQRGICFRGGLQTNLIDDHFVDGITSLRIAELWLACDTDEALPTVQEKLTTLVERGFTRHQLHVYSLIGKNMEKEEERNRAIWRSGAMPFSQLQMGFERERTEYSVQWKAFERLWQRPALMYAHMREVENCDTMTLFEES